MTRANFLVFLLAAFAVSLGYGMITPYLGSLSREGVSGATLGLMSASYPVAKGLGFLASATLSRQPRADLLLFLACSAYAAMAMFDQPFTWAAARFVEGAAFGWLMGLAARMIAETAQSRVGERLAWLNGVSSAAVFCGPLLAWMALSLNQGWTAFAVAALLCLSIGLTARFPAVQARPSTTTASFKGIGDLVFCFFLFDFTYGVLSVVLPLAFAHQMDAGAGLTTTVFSAGFVIFLIGLPLFGYLYDRGAHRLLQLGLLTAALLFTTAWYLEVEGTTLVGLILVEYIAAAAAYAAAAARLGTLLPEGLGLAGAIQSVGLACGALIGGIVNTHIALGLLAGAYALALPIVMRAQRAREHSG